MKNHNRRLLTFGLAFFLTSSTLSFHISDYIAVTDEWNFWTTNVQTVFSILGTVLIPFSFLSAYHYFKRAQGDVAAIIRERKADFKRRKFPHRDNSDGSDEDGDVNSPAAARRGHEVIEHLHLPASTAPIDGTADAHLIEDENTADLVLRRNLSNDDD